MQSTAPVAPQESGAAGLGLSPAAMQYLIRMSVGERRRRLVVDIIRIVIRPQEPRSQGRREGKSSTVTAPAWNHESFGAIKSFRKDRRDRKAVRLTNQRRQVGILGINEVALSSKAGGCTQRARATHWEQVGLKWCRDLLLTVIVVHHCKGQGSGTSGFMGGFVAGNKLLVCMHSSMWEATLYPLAQTEDKRWIFSNCSRNSNSGAHLHLVPQPGRKLLACCWPTCKNSSVLSPVHNRQLLERSLHSPLIPPFPDHFNKRSSTSWPSATDLPSDLHVRPRCTRV